MILYFRITADQKRALLFRYPDIRNFVEKTISDEADKIIIERGQFDVEKELQGYHDRLVLNGAGPHRKRKMTQETKDKIRKSLEKYFAQFEGQEFHLFPETKEAIRLANIGKHSGKRSEEAKLKMSLAKKGKELTEEHKRNIGLGHKGKKYKVKEKS